MGGLGYSREQLNAALPKLGWAAACQVSGTWRTWYTDAQNPNYRRLPQLTAEEKAQLLVLLASKGSQT